MREDRPIEDKIAELPNEGEQDGFAKQLSAESRMTKRLENLIELRREALRRNGGRK